MHKKLQLLVLVVMFLTTSIVVNANEISSSNICTDSEFGIQFYCESDWKWRRRNDAMLIVISTSPMITFTLKRFDEGIRYLEQLSYDTLKEKGLYATGFDVERTQLADRKALKVKAVSNEYSDIRLTDYYFLHNTNLYGAQFTVYPKDQFDDKQLLIQKLSKSIEFLDE